jgi:flagellin
VSGLIADGVSLDIDSTIGLVRSAYDAARGTFKAEVQDRFDQYVHLADNAARLQIGANEGENMILTLGAMTAHALGISDIDVRSREAAARGITRLDNALSRVSSQRAIIGSQINRLEHTINNLTTASANTTAAESRIRDTDMAKEMMNFTKLNILTMMGSSMMAQANMIPENILPLMR